MKTSRVIGVSLVVALGVALGGAAFASKGSKPASQAPRVHVARHVSRTTGQHSLSAVRPLAELSTHSADTDNVQAGDQTTPDSQDEQSSDSASEGGSDPEAGQSGEPAHGHEDQAGRDQNHECTGSCQE